MQWFKAHCNTLTSPRMLCLRSEERGGELFAFWMLLHVLAASKGGDPIITFSKERPYTPRQLGASLGFSEEFTIYALEKLQEHEYIIIYENGAIKLVGWENEQSYPEANEKANEKESGQAKKKASARKREYDRLYQQKRRDEAKQKKLNDVLATKNDDTATKNDSSYIYKEIDKEKQKDTEAEAEKDARERECTAVQELYNSICKSYPQISFLSKQQMRYLSSVLDEVSTEQFKRCFELAEESDFLKGKGWVSFDWLIRPENIAKVCNGNYRNDSASPTSQNPPQEVSETLSSFDADEFLEAALARGFDD